MSMRSYGQCVSLVLLTAAICGCGRPATETRTYPPGGAVANGGMVDPLKDDSSDQIVSWVDGQVVSDWTSEIAKRRAAIDGYLNDADPARAEKYGFRSGQNPRLAWDWFQNNPVGFNGVPFVVLKTLLDLDPNHQNATLRKIARIWKREASFPSGSGAGATAWTLDHLGRRTQSCRLR